jgi:GntR family transcriptional regulator
MSREVVPQTLGFVLSSGSGVPAYLQVVHQVEQALRVGHLSPGDRLPTVKEVVGQVAMNPNTVLKAYRELEHRGLVEGRQGVGTFVVGRPPGPTPQVHTRLAKTLERWVVTARDAGLDDASIESLVRGALQRGTVEDVA